MVREHLPMVFSPFFDIDDHYLLEPEGVLGEDVPFSYSGDLSIGPIGPEILEIEPVVRAKENVLLLLEPSLFFGKLGLTIPNGQKTV